MTTVKIVDGVRVVKLEVEPDSTCEMCGAIDELRPYGPNGERICYECGKKDQSMTNRRMKQHLFGEGFDA